MLVQIPGTNLMRDTESMALINMDNSEKNDYYSKLKLIQNQKEQINTIKQEINGVKDDISDIKTLLKQLLDKQ
jgi:archaellum component FlaC